MRSSLDCIPCFARQARERAGNPGTAFDTITVPILNHDTHDNAIPPAQDSKETKPMKIAIPVADGRLCMHFGHCEQFAIVDVDESSRAVTATRYLTPPPHEPGVLPRWLHEQGATVILAGGMGQRAQSLFAESGVQVVVGAPPVAVDKVVAAYLSGTLQVGPNACDH